ncbi:hypothetical protein N9D23_09725, partial [Rubripirellula sp.]|nr:hypothetical protein [Rubripirellula sp.]
LLGMVLPLLCLAVLGISFFYSISTMGIELSEHEALKYFDIDKLNSTRASLSRGSGRMFRATSQDSAWGQNTLTDITLAAKALWFAIAGVDLTDLRSARQMLATPEAFLILYSLPSMIAGIINLWRNNIRAALPIILVTLAIVAVYGAGTTNMGAMYRWRIQALPGALLLVYYGAACRQKSLFYTIVRNLRRTDSHQPSARPQSLAA